MFEDYLDEHFSIDRVSGGRELLLNDDCPFCSGTGKIYINAKSGRGMCHKCSTGFSPIKFIMAHQGCGYSDAKAILEKGTGWQRMEEEEPEEDPLWFPPAAAFEGDPAAYLNGRGISEGLRLYARMYYCDQNVQIEDRVFWTSKRIIIPIYDREGNPASWQGRDITGRSKIKYLFPPGFRGAEHLYNIHNVQPGKLLVICEGAFDALGWIRAGVTNVVATFGKKMSELQLSQIAALKPSCLFLAWDSDAAWQKYGFVERSGHLFNDVRLVDLDGKDADELDRSALRLALHNAKRYSWEDKILQMTRL